MKGLFLNIALILSFSVITAQEVSKWDFLSASNQKEQSKIVKSVLKSDITGDSLIKLLQLIEYSPAKENGLIRFENKCIDDTIRDFSVYIPKSYDETKNTPLFVYLHGGVGMKDILPDSTWLEYINSLPWINMAEEQGFICLFPKGEYTAMWWDTVGSANILSQIRIVKQKYNINNNKVYLSGFSDGASANYFMAMSHPTDFACFTPLNGHPGVGGFTHSTETFFVNLSNSVLHSINTDIDGLYPDKKIQPMISLANELGGNILYRVYEGIGHRMTYINKELPNILDFYAENPRNRFPTKIVWETVKPKQGKCSWLKITETDTLQERKAWHTDKNLKMYEDRLSFGFMDDRTFEGEGIKVARVTGGKTLCNNLGIKAGDIFTKLDTFNVVSMKDMVAFKKVRQRGDSVYVEINRNDTILKLNGKFPDVIEYDLFNRIQKSGRINAHYIANTFYVETSRVKTFEIYIHPQMVQIDQNVKVYLNDKLVFDEKIKYDKQFILDNYFKNRDLSLLYLNSIRIDL